MDDVIVANDQSLPENNTTEPSSKALICTVSNHNTSSSHESRACDTAVDSCISVNKNRTPVGYNDDQTTLLTHEERSILKTTLALVIIKCRYQESQKQGNRQTHGYTDNTSNANNTLCNTTKSSFQQQKVLSSTNESNNNYATSILPQISCLPMKQNQKFMIPYKKDGWYERLEYLMQIALFSYYETEKRITKSTITCTSSSSSRFEGLVLHIACQLAQMHELLQEENQKTDVVSCHFRECNIGDQQLVRPSTSSTREEKNSTADVKIIKKASSSITEKHTETAASVTDCDDENAATPNRTKQTTSDAHLDNTAKLKQSTSHWIRNHLLNHHDDFYIDINRSSKLDSFSLKNAQFQPVVKRFDVTFFPVWEKMFTMKPIEICLMLVPVLLDLILLPFDHQDAMSCYADDMSNSYSDTETKTSDTDAFQSQKMHRYMVATKGTWYDCTYYWYRLLQLATNVIVSVLSRSCKIVTSSSTNGSTYDNEHNYYSDSALDRQLLLTLHNEMVTRLLQYMGCHDTSINETNSGGRLLRGLNHLVETPTHDVLSISDLAYKYHKAVQYNNCCSHNNHNQLYRNSFKRSKVSSGFSSQFYGNDYDDNVKQSAKPIPEQIGKRFLLDIALSKILQQLMMVQALIPSSSD